MAGGLRGADRQRFSFFHVREPGGIGSFVAIGIPAFFVRGQEPGEGNHRSGCGEGGGLGTGRAAHRHINF